MSHHTQSCTLAAIFLATVALFSGCGNNENERQAKITGTVDKSSNLSPAETKRRGQNGPKDMPSNYPAANGAKR